LENNFSKEVLDYIDSLLKDPKDDELDFEITVEYEEEEKEEDFLTWLQK
jgi:hypothetical protein